MRRTSAKISQLNGKIVDIGISEQGQWLRLHRDDGVGGNPGFVSGGIGTGRVGEKEGVDLVIVFPCIDKEVIQFHICGEG